MDIDAGYALAAHDMSTVAFPIGARAKRVLCFYPGVTNVVGSLHVYLHSNIIRTDPSLVFETILAIIVQFSEEKKDKQTLFNLYHRRKQ